jgi:hypothetical protein
MIPLPSFSDIKDLVKNGFTLEAQEKIMQLREAALELQEENLNLKNEKTDLENKLKITGELQFVNQFYWRPNDLTPFCPRCWEKDRVTIHISPEIEKYYEIVRSCPECKREYKIRDIPVTLPQINIPRESWDNLP